LTSRFFFNINGARLARR